MAAETLIIIGSDNDLFPFFGTKPLTEPGQTSCQLDHQEYTPMKVESKLELFIQHKLK